MSSATLDSSQSEQAVGRRDRAAPDQAPRDQQPGGGRGLAFVEARRVAQRTPAVGASAAPEAVAAERQPVGGVHAGVAPSQPAAAGGE